MWDGLSSWGGLTDRIGRAHRAGPRVAKLPRIAASRNRTLGRRVGQAIALVVCHAFSSQENLTDDKKRSSVPPDRRKV
jgi:hypothetical protein